MKDQELEKLMRQITKDAILDDASANEIAESPALWWSVQREIRNATPEKAPWPPKFLSRLLMIGVPVAAALVIGFAFYVNSVRTIEPATANGPSQDLPPTAAPGRMVNDPGTDQVRQPTALRAGLSRNEHSTSKPIRAVQRTHARLPKTLIAANSRKAATEIKSDFIALAYARSPESGQLVRVKVPSSMMVQLGLVSTVDKPSELVDAEVLVGDDGLTHAIRFIRQ